jgi:hypothetical protein
MKIYILIILILCFVKFVIRAYVHHIEDDVYEQKIRNSFIALAILTAVAIYFQIFLL